MHVLVTGGSGVIGEGLLPPLLAAGHRVRLLARGADAAAREWPDGVEPFAADVTRPDQLAGAVDGCDAVVHITGIVVEEPPEVTYERVNVDGTRHLLAECARSGCPRFVFISSLAAERGTSPYHASKRASEALVRDYAGHWIIVRPGNVYGPGDEVIAKVLSMFRALPAIPVVGAGDQRFQPIWYRDLGNAIARAVERDVASGVYEAAGEEITTPDNLLARFEQLTERSPLRIPIPEFVAAAGTRLADALHVPLPFNEAQFKMLIEHNVIEPPARNALSSVFGVTPTPMAIALRELADDQPEQTPKDGIGGLERKRFWADIAQSRLDPEQLLLEFRRRCTEVMPIEFDTEPGTPQEVIEGATLTAHLPMRGNVQIRVVEATERAVMFATLRGHPLAGAVRFSTSAEPGGVVRFMVSVFARAASALDWMALTAGGAAAQNTTWRTVVARVAALAGAEASEVQEQKDILHGDECTEIEAWLDDVIERRRRAVHTQHVADS